MNSSTHKTRRFSLLINSFWGLSLLALTGCQSVKEFSLPLSPSLTKNAQVLEINRPTWQLSDTAYHQQSGAFQIDGAHTSWGSMQRSQSWFEQSDGLIKGVEIQDKFLRFVFLDLFDLREKTISHFQLRGERDFAFTVSNPLAPAVQSRCRLLYLSNRQDTVREFGPAKTQTTSLEQRKYSYLACEFTQEGQQWHLVVDTLGNGTPTLSMYSEGSTNWRLEAISEHMGKVGEQWVNLPGLGKKIAGISFFQSDLQLKHNQESQAISAMSFDGPKPRIWLDQELPASQQAVLLATSYSLLMYDWLDNVWRTSQNINQ